MLATCPYNLTHTFLPHLDLRISSHTSEPILHQFLPILLTKSLIHHPFTSLSPIHQTHTQGARISYIGGGKEIKDLKRSQYANGSLLVSSFFISSLSFDYE